MSEPIKIDPPIKVQAVPEKTFDIYFVTELRITEITPTSGNLAFTMTPMDSQTGEMMPSMAEGVQVPLWDAVSQLDVAASALGSVLSALPAIRDHFKA